MKLYDVPNGSKVRVFQDDVRTPPSSPPLVEGDVFTFHHIDGMYSYCTTEDGEVVHPAAWTEVEIVK